MPPMLSYSPLAMKSLISWVVVAVIPAGGDAISVRDDRDADSPRDFLEPEVAVPIGLVAGEAVHVVDQSLAIELIEQPLRAELAYSIWLL